MSSTMIVIAILAAYVMVTLAVTYFTRLAEEVWPNSMAIPPAEFMAAMWPLLLPLAVVMFVCSHVYAAIAASAERRGQQIRQRRREREVIAEEINQLLTPTEPRP